MQSNPPEADSRVAPCRGCGAVMNRIGTELFSVGGTSGILELFFRGYADLTAPTLPLELWVCPSCRRLEMRLPLGYSSPLTGGRGPRFACPNCGGDAYQGDATCSSCGKPLPPFP